MEIMSKRKTVTPVRNRTAFL